MQNETRNNLKRQKMPDVDKVLRLGIIRICQEYKRISLQKDNLTATDMKMLADISKMLLAFKKEPGFREIEELQHLTVKQTPEEQMADILGAAFGDETAEE